MLNYNTNEKTSVMFNERGKPIGKYDEKSLHKNLYPSKHLLLKPRGWASDVFVLKEAERIGLEFIIIHDRENNVDYKSRIKDFWIRGIPINRGYGDQICLPLIFWNITQPGKPVDQQMILPF